jgi:hypothetical protein
MAPSANCFSDGSISFANDLTALNFQPVSNREDGLNVEFQKVHFIILGIALPSAFAGYFSMSLTGVA